jgi:hypothetical protein
MCLAVSKNFWPHCRDDYFPGVALDDATMARAVLVLILLSIGKI